MIDLRNLDFRENHQGQRYPVNQALEWVGAVAATRSGIDVAGRVSLDGWPSETEIAQGIPYIAVHPPGPMRGMNIRAAGFNPIFQREAEEASGGFEVRVEVLTAYDALNHHECFAIAREYASMLELAFRRYTDEGQVGVYQTHVTEFGAVPTDLALIGAFQILPAYCIVRLMMIVDMTYRNDLHSPE